MIKFEVGDTVKLKSGGPVMTVSNVQSFSSFSDTISVNWFCKDGFVMQAVFDSRTLDYAGTQCSDKDTND